MAKKEKMEVHYVPRNKLIKNEKNGFSIKRIERLAQDINMAGLEQPLVVYATGDEGGKYKVLTGERRLTAIDMLIESGKWTSDIPVIIKELDEYDLPLPLELKESFAILRTNIFSRGDMDDEDKFFAATEYAKIVKELRKQGYKELILGYDKDGEKITESITGRVREVIHNLTDISNGQISKIEKIESKGTDDLKQALKDKRININNAEKLVSLPEKKQKEILEKNEMITPEVVRISLEQDKLSAYGTKRKIWPDDSLIESEGCEGGHDCFCCHLQCDIRQKDCYCVEAPLEKTYPCTTLHIVETSKKEMGEKCQFVKLELAKKRAGDQAPVPCCKECSEICAFRCQKALNSKKKDTGEDILSIDNKMDSGAKNATETKEKKEYSPLEFVLKYAENNKKNMDRFIEICKKNKNNMERAKAIQKCIAPYGYSGEHANDFSCTFQGMGKGLDFIMNGQKIKMTYVQFAKLIEEFYGPWKATENEKIIESNFGKLPDFQNNEQRKEWCENYQEWGLWYRDENIDVNYYKFEFQDGSRLIAVEYPQREVSWTETKTDEVKYHLLMKNKTRSNSERTYDEKFRHTYISMKDLVDFIKKIG